MDDLIDRALAEDIGGGDVTSSAVVPADARASARVVQKGEGVIAGLRVAEAAFRRVDPELSWRAEVEEGDWRGGGPVAEVSGAARSILAAERVALNFLGHLSGVATLTARFVRAIEGTHAHILDTRKTTPGLRALEKEAVVAGGGQNYRDGLFDGILVKENHARLAGGVGAAAEQALAAASEGGAPGVEDESVGPPRMDVTVECTTLVELEEALAAGAPQVMLDNMTLDELRAAVARGAERTVLEASGGVTLDSVRAIAETGVDVISVGALTHSAPALDLSLQLEPHPAPGSGAS